MVAHFMVSRNKRERRVALLANPPYMSEEGMVLIDRRVEGERRAVQRQSASARIDAAVPYAE